MKIIRFFLFSIFLSLLLNSGFLHASVFPFSFAQSGFSILKFGLYPHVKVGDKTLINPWSGGLNAVHVATIDLNGDTEEDLLVYDRIGQRALCFLYEPTTNSSSGETFDLHFPYKYHPEYSYLLPLLSSWVQAYDYNGDGKKDLFTFNSVSGICIYKNISQIEKGRWKLKFTPFTDRLPVRMYGQYSGLYCTSVDYPALVDIDGDGAVDILNFWVPSTGDYLHYYRNYALETYGTLDSVDFRIEDWSWGCFIESEESNAIYLDSCRLNPPVAKENSRQVQSKDREPKHSGSTLCALPSAEYSGAYDLLVGDVSYNHLMHLYNNPISSKAHIYKYDSLFPMEGKNASLPVVNLSSFPVVSPMLSPVSEQILGIDKTLLCISPFSSSVFNTQGSQSVWLYSWKSISESTLLQKDFIQNTMMDEGIASIPVFYDYNRDGLLDLVVAYYGQPQEATDLLSQDPQAQWGGLTLYQNTGTKEQAQFEYKTNDFLHIKNYKLQGLCPAFGDYNQDGKDELLLGLQDGRIWAFDLLYEQGKEGVAQLTDSLFLNLQTSGFSAPTLFDLNRDGRLDLVIGSKQQIWITPEGKRYTKASLRYYQNTGQLDTPFVFVTDSLGGVDVIDRSYSNYGYARPSFYATAQNQVYLLCGGQNGKLWTYTIVHTKEDFLPSGFLPVWNQLSEENVKSSELSVGELSAPAWADLNADGFPDLVVGTAGGGLIYASGIPYREPDPVGNEAIHENGPQGVQERVAYREMEAYPNPVSQILHIKVEEPLLYSLTDLWGRCYLRGSWPSGWQRLSVVSLPSGVYLLHCKAPLLTPAVYRPLKIVKY